MKKNFLSRFKLKFLILTLTAFFIFSLCGCGETAGEVAEKNLSEEKPDPIEETLKKMTLEEKIGQMIFIGVYGKEINDDIKFLLNQYHFGGVIYFDRNMDNKAQVKKFSEELQAESLNANNLPLFIALDEEGGRVARMKHDLIPPPSQEERGLSGDFNLEKNTAENLSESLREIGVNVNFAPVADVGSKDTRSFSDDANTVAKFLSAAAQGYEEKKFFYCLKHFPGIGRGKVDTHKDVSFVDDDRETLKNEDVLPFKKIIGEHDNSKFMVMIGHLKYSAFDSENSASISSEIITNLLRNELNFQGVVITDDLNMGAIANYSDIESVTLQTIKAGTDIALICHEPELQKRAFEALLSAVNKKEISEERINESVRRILKMKLNL